MENITDTLMILGNYRLCENYPPFFFIKLNSVSALINPPVHTSTMMEQKKISERLQLVELKTLNLKPGTDLVVGW
jgi:hypothetical protein